MCYGPEHANTSERRPRQRTARAQASRPNANAASPPQPTTPEKANVSRGRLRTSAEDRISPLDRRQDQQDSEVKAHPQHSQEGHPQPHRQTNTTHPVPRYQGTPVRPAASSTQPHRVHRQEGYDPTGLRPPPPTNKRYYQKDRQPPPTKTPTPKNTTTPNRGNPQPRTRGIPHPAPYHRGMPWTTSDRHQRLPKHWNKTRKQVLAKANYQCEGFTPPPPSPRPAGGGAWVTDPYGRLHSPHCTGRATDVDHIIPTAEGGTDDPTNLRPLSHPCHTTTTCAHNTRRHTAIRAAATRPHVVHPGNIER